MGPVQEQGPDDADPHPGKGPVRALPAMRGSACNQPACFTSVRLIADIFVLTGDIGGRGRGRGSAERSERMQNTKRRQGWGRRSRGENQGRRRGDTQLVRGEEEEDGSDKDDGGMDKQETERDGGIIDNQRRSRGEVPRVGD